MVGPGWSACSTPAAWPWSAARAGCRISTAAVSAAAAKMQDVRIVEFICNDPALQLPPYTDLVTSPDERSPEIVGVGSTGTTEGVVGLGECVGEIDGVKADRQFPRDVVGQLHVQI